MRYNSVSGEKTQNYPTSCFFSLSDSFNSDSSRFAHRLSPFIFFGSQSAQLRFFQFACHVLKSVRFVVPRVPLSHYFLCFSSISPFAKSNITINLSKNPFCPTTPYPFRVILGKNPAVVRNLTSPIISPTVCR